jgi:large subunit ribosomal protein L31
MKEGIHPNYVATTITCACGNTLQSRSTRSTIKLDICSNCHPFFTGNQKLIDTAGRVERFEKRFSKTSGETLKKAESLTKNAKGQKLVNPKVTLAKIMKTVPIAIPVKVKRSFDGKGDGRSGGKPTDKKAAAPDTKAK